MTSPETIRATLARLWDTGANGYELAQAVMQAADIESSDLELEVESVISRALLAREFVDLSKVAAEMAKLLPGAEVRLPLCEAIKAEIKMSPFTELKEALAATWCMEIMDKQFAAFSVEEVARVLAVSIYHSEGLETMNYAGERDYANREWQHYEKEAQAVLRLLRKE